MIDFLNLVSCQDFTENVFMQGAEDNFDYVRFTLVEFGNYNRGPHDD